jgi:hypothetical protein
LIVDKMNKVTMYVRSEFGMGIRKIEAREATVDVKPYAQYARGIFVEFKRARERRARWFVQAYGPSLVILDGWGHPDPDGMWDESTRSSVGEVETVRGRYAACDPRWQGDFDAKLAAYLEEKGNAILLYDFRRHSPGCAGMISSCDCFSCEVESGVNEWERAS